MHLGADLRVGITGIMLSASKIDLSLEIIVFKLECDELSVGGGNRTVNRRWSERGKERRRGNQRERGSDSKKQRGKIDER